MRLLILLAAALPVYSQITVSTFAGGVIRSGVPAQNVYLENIAALTWDPAGNVVFCDQANSVIRRVRKDGILETIAGTGVTGSAGDGGPATAAVLTSPSAPVYDSAGNLYFIEYANHRVRRVDSKGIISTVAGNGIAYTPGATTTGPAIEIALGDLAGLAVGPSGKVYLLDTSLNRVRLLTADGQLQNFAAFSDDGPLTSSLTSDGAGNLYVIQGSGLRYEAILRIAPNGSFTTFREWQAAPNSWVAAPHLIAADAQGNVYGIEGGSILRFNPDGSDTPLAGGGQNYASSPDGPALPSVINPTLLAVNAQGDIAFADKFVFVNYYLILAEIRVITADSKLRSLAGNAPQIVPDGTPLASAWFENLTSIAFSRSGDLYVGDFRSCQIRKIGVDGVLSTFAGTGNCAYPAPSGPNAKTADIVQPCSLAVDSQNRVWVADYYLNLYSIAQDGAISPIIQTPVIGGKGLLGVDAKDRVYVLGLDSLYRVLPDGSYQRLLGPATGFTGIGADAFGNVYLSAYDEVYTVNDDGTFALVYTNTGGGSSLAIDSAHRAWLGGSSIIDLVSSSGMTRIAGGLAGFSGDGGPAQSALFTYPTSLAFSPSGDLYLIDGNRIRKLSGIQATLPAPAIAPEGIVNAASYAGGAISPGELVSIFGSNFGADRLEIATPVGATYPSAFGPASVLFNGTPGAITAIAPNQINVFVPPGVPSGATASVVVKVGAAVSLPVTLPIAAATPGIFTADSSGAGQGAILNQDASINSPSHPEARGNIVSIYGTGLGLTTPPSAVTVAIGGQPAEVVYAGAAPSLAPGVFQINARIPAAIPPGNAAVSVTAAGAASAGRVTVAVR